MALFYQSATRNLPDGYTFRGAMLNDIPVIAYLFNQSQMNQLSGNNFPFAEMRTEWKTPQFNPALDVRLVFDQREHLIGYIEVWTVKGLETHPWLWGCVHPDYEGRGIGTALLRWAEARVTLAMELLPANWRVAPRFGTLRTLKTAPALCAALGWQLLQKDQDITLQPIKLASALRLAQNTGLPNCGVYSVYEKEIRPGKEPYPKVM